jgi:hypothetical protein
MADEMVGKKPGEEGGAGVENEEAESPETEGAEAGGRRHHRRLLYTCWHDGASNYVHGHWTWFTCWRCGALNYM